VVPAAGRKLHRLPVKGSVPGRNCVNRRNPECKRELLLHAVILALVQPSAGREFGASQEALRHCLPPAVVENSSLESRVHWGGLMEGMGMFAVGAALFLLTVLGLTGLLKRRKPVLGATPLGSSPGARVTESQPASAPAPAARPGGARGDARWFEPGQKITVAGIAIQGGLFYLGRSLPTQAGHGVENCLINPRLPIARHSNKSGQGMPYWPNYSAIDPSSRRAYLEWLARSFRLHRR
jgi:TerB N-terminal domain